MNLLDSKLATTGPLQHSRQERVQLGGGLGLMALEGVEPGLQSFDMGDTTPNWLGHRNGLKAGLACT